MKIKRVGLASNVKPEKEGIYLTKGADYRILVIAVNFEALAEMRLKEVRSPWASRQDLSTSLWLLW